MSTDDIPRLIASAARSLQDEVGSQHTMEKVVELAVGMIDNAEHAGVSLLRQGRIESSAASDDMVRRVDELQYEHREGPCVDAILDDEVVHSRDIAHDERWPRWGSLTTEETGIRSMLCFRMFTIEDTVGALNLYSTRAGAFDADDREVGLALTAHAALAVVASQQIETLHLAVDSRTVIGQAVGILMERFDMDADRAFGVLKRVSQESNRKLRDVAHELVATRRTPH